MDRGLTQVAERGRRGRLRPNHVREIFAADTVLDINGRVGLPVRRRQLAVNEPQFAAEQGLRLLPGVRVDELGFRQPERERLVALAGLDELPKLCAGLDQLTLVCEVVAQWSVLGDGGFGMEEPAVVRDRRPMRRIAPDRSIAG